jgi:YbbR domain-containing protein
MFKYWYLKLFALVLAVLLWFVAWGLASGTKEIQGVPIEVKNLKTDLAYSLDSYEVGLKVAADKTELDSLSSDSFKATLDLNNWEKGTYQGHVEIKGPNGVEIFSVSPENLTVRIEDRAEKEVILLSRVDGLPADGYLVGNAELKPNKAVASGPQSEIKNLNSGTVVFKLSREKENLSGDFPIVAFNEQDKQIRSISFTPDKVKATLYIFSGSNNKAVGIKPKITGTPMAGYWISNVQTIPSTIIVNSNQGNLEKIESVETSLFDVTGLSKNVETKVDIILPAGIASVENIKQVTLLVDFSTLETTRELFGSISFKNTPFPHRVTRISPQTVNVVVSGPTSLLRSLTSSAISIEVDLKDKDVGTSRIELNKDNIKVPEGVGVVSLLPNVVEVTIE